MVSRPLRISCRFNRNRWEPHNPVLPHRHALDPYAAWAATHDQDAIVTRERDTGRFIEAYTHDVSEALNSVLDVGFQIERVGEWRAESAPRSAAPRLFSSLVRRS
jgi:hypothetical protein